MKGNALVAQSGGPTAVINASAAGVIHAAMEAPEIRRILAAHKGDFARDAFGHVQLGGAGQALQALVQSDCHVKARIAMPSTIQRTGAHFASLTDNEEAYGAGRKAVEAARDGITDMMGTLVRESENPYRCGYGLTELSKAANGEKAFPPDWISPDGFHVTEGFLRYARPLLQGETKPPMKDGLPRCVRTAKHFMQEVS